MAVVCILRSPTSGANTCKQHRTSKYGICSGGEWEVGLRGDEGREAQYGGEDNHKERGIIGFAGAKYALDAE